mmetsp:Transcript_71803/g.191534  ORF Transcript_71803/g.191534 Transcript_71803/m.191534 type:complete len:1269 (+) Transcript_71803:67-3873(+)
MRQIRLSTGGVQSWYRGVTATSTDHFAYASTMSIHIFRRRDMSLVKMLTSESNLKNITSICWCPLDETKIAVAHAGNQIRVFDIETEELDPTRPPCSTAHRVLAMDWSPTSPRLLAYITETGKIHILDLSSSKVTHTYSSPSTNGFPEHPYPALRWHPTVNGRLLLGAPDGSLTVINNVEGKKSTVESKVKNCPVEDVQWDPLSTDYLLVAWKMGDMALFDIAQKVEVFRFDRLSQGIRSIAWVRSEPGNFVTVTDKVGVLRKWNVSQRAPIDMIKVGVSGLSSVKAFPAHPSLFLMSFLNGSIGVLDVIHRKMEFLSSPGHSETIFDCAFSPGNPNLLASGSYDGYVKLWNVATGETEREFTTQLDRASGQELIYAVSFSPESEGKICAVTRAGTLHIWILASGKETIVQQVTKGSRPLFRVQWSQQNPRWIAIGGGCNSSGNTGGCVFVVDSTTGEVLERFKHPKDATGVSWCPTDGQKLATGCVDGVVRIFNLHNIGTCGEQTPTRLEGHSERIFNVAWHPLVPKVLASGSDDRTVRVWEGETEMRCLRGHTSFVRPVLWHHERPNILFSGSWDSTIRVWDVATSTCLYVATEHHADVYGLASHPDRPFFLASTSRDTSLRCWVVEDLAMPFMLKAVVHPESVAEIVSLQEPSAWAVFGNHADSAPPLLLHGAGSKALLLKLQGELGGNFSGANCVKAFKHILSFFMYRKGLDDLWDLCLNIRGEPATSTSNVIFHEKDLIASYHSRAQQLRSTTVGIAGIMTKKDDRLRKAADILLRIGDIRGYCECMRECGQWERAISIAPAVSQKFWFEMCQRYAQQLDATSPNEAAPFLVATGMVDRLRDFCLERNELENAFVIAKAHCDGKYPSKDPPAVVPVTQSSALDGETARVQMESIARVLSDRYLEGHDTIQAVECLLAVSDVHSAVELLLRCYEPMLAFVCTKMLLGDQLGSQWPETLELLALQSERHVLRDLAKELWAAHPRAAERTSLLAVRMDPSILHPAEYYKTMAEQALGDADYGTAVFAFVCAGEYTHAVGTAVPRLHGLFSDLETVDPASPPGMALREEMRRIVDALSFMPVPQMTVPEISKVLACASHAGLIEACARGYHDIGLPLAQTTRNIIRAQNLEFPVSIGDMFLKEVRSRGRFRPAEALAALQRMMVDNTLAPGDMEKAQLLAGELMAAAHEAEVTPIAARDQQTILAGANLPAGGKGDARVSVVTTKPIRGAAVVLEDGRSFISQTEAVAWGRVNPFSPLNTGGIMLPP